MKEMKGKCKVVERMTGVLARVRLRAKLFSKKINDRMKNPLDMRITKRSYAEEAGVGSVEVSTYVRKRDKANKVEA